MRFSFKDNAKYIHRVHRIQYDGHPTKSILIYWSNADEDPPTEVPLFPDFPDSAKMKLQIMKCYNCNNDGHSKRNCKTIATSNIQDHASRGQVSMSKISKQGYSRTHRTWDSFKNNEKVFHFDLQDYPAIQHQYQRNNNMQASKKECLDKSPTNKSDIMVASMKKQLQEVTDVILNLQDTLTQVQEHQSEEIKLLKRLHEKEIQDLNMQIATLQQEKNNRLDDLATDIMDKGADELVQATVIDVTDNQDVASAGNEKDSKCQKKQKALDLGGGEQPRKENEEDSDSESDVASDVSNRTTKTISCNKEAYGVCSPATKIAGERATRTCKVK